MKKEENSLFKFNSISEAHQTFGFPKPAHPLISVINRINPQPGELTIPNVHVLGFYKISYLPSRSGNLKYGQDYYDFNEGGLLFAAPNQIIGNEKRGGAEGTSCSQFILLIHPDFLLGSPLAGKIRQYGFFSYSANEALHLSESEKNTIFAIFSMIERELNSRIDDFSQEVMLSQLELLLNYANRFYKRQFITRKQVNSQLLQKLEALIDDYFESGTALQSGVPSVHYMADQLALSPGYLSDMLRSLTGQNARQFLHEKLIAKAKEKLSATELSVSEVAYALGFEHSQSFSKLFKTKTNLSPLEFRRSFN
nr:helix-turn-helix domain-containing protein [uncultured Arsenicibacter sp.]